MRYLLVGLGNLGQRRRAMLADRCVATVDPNNPAADGADPSAVRPDLYDAAVLSIPNDAKLDLLERFLALGKHVLVDKPLLVSAADAERLRQAAAYSGAIWYTSYNHRFEPLIAQLKQRIDAGALGELYHARLSYGNGTVGNVIGSWRDTGLGVVEDLMSHLLDLADYLLGYGGRGFEAVTVNRHEASVFDQAILRSMDGRVVLEASFVSWRNTFTVELWGRHGSLHLQGLRKWGGAELIERRRVYPSGVPTEASWADAGPDDSWLTDLAHFEQRATRGQSSLESDRWITDTLLTAASRFA